MIRDYTVFTVPLVMPLIQISADSTLTDAEKEEKAHALMREKLAEFYGQEIVDAIEAQEEALGGLSEDARSALERSGCLGSVSEAGGN